MKKPLLVYLLLLGYLGTAQSTASNGLEDLGRINLGLHGLELSYEFPLSKQFVWENNLGIGMGMEAFAGSPTFTFYLYRPTPFIKSQLKWIYNRNKRERKGKNSQYNAGNYIGLQGKYSFGDSDLFDISQAVLTEIHWGIQRSIGGRFTFNLHLGMGVVTDFDFSDNAFSPTFGLRFGYRIF
ncbi:MAG: hypothetical protein AAGF77_12410 [Bacteroidota bacterium]